MINTNNYKIEIELSNGDYKIIDENYFINYVKTSIDLIEGDYTDDYLKLIYEKMINLENKKSNQEIIHNLDRLIIESSEFLLINDVFFDNICKSFTLLEIYKNINTKINNINEFYDDIDYLQIVKNNINKGYYNDKLLSYDLVSINNYFNFKRDNYLSYNTLKIIRNKYLIKDNDGIYLETPQIMFMRVVLGVSYNEKDNNIIKSFYDIISKLKFLPNHIVLLHSGTNISNLSSDYINTVEDDLHYIYVSMSNNAKIMKYSGSISNDWSKVRTSGAEVKGNKINSNGSIPFIKTYSDTASAINRTDYKNDKICSYLEIWHRDVEEFINLRRNVGDERRRTPEMKTAIMIPDLFMERLLEEKEWTLFSPDETIELYNNYGRVFEKFYSEYEKKSDNNELLIHHKIKTTYMFKNILMSLFENSNPYIVFKDNINKRNMENGIVHSCGLNTELCLVDDPNDNSFITGTINLSNHNDLNKDVDYSELQKTIKMSIRFLDNCVDFSNNPITNKINEKRSIGLGLTGYQDLLFKLNKTYVSTKILNNFLTEFTSFYAYYYSKELAKEKGMFKNCDKTKWVLGNLPVDSYNIKKDKFTEEDLTHIDENIINKKKIMNWEELRNNLKEHGIRNSSIVAYTDNNELSEIFDCYNLFEGNISVLKQYRNSYGNYFRLDKFLMEKLKEKNLLTNLIIDEIKHYEGDIMKCMNIPNNIKNLFGSFSGMKAKDLIFMCSIRSKWIDQSESFNIHLKEFKGSILKDLYLFCWKLGIKSTFNLIKINNKFINPYVPKEKKTNSIVNKPLNEEWTLPETTSGSVVNSSQVCNLLNPECESCQ